MLHCVDKKEASLFVDQWAPTFLLLGLYNKIVKVAGAVASDGPVSRAEGNGSASTAARFVWVDRTQSIAARPIAGARSGAGWGFLRALSAPFARLIVNVQGQPFNCRRSLACRAVQRIVFTPASNASKRPNRPYLLQPSLAIIKGTKYGGPRSYGIRNECFVVGHVEPVIYRIDAEDIIKDVNVAWCRFAVENNAPYLATEAIDKSLWDYISGIDVRRIYAAVFKRVRQQQCTMSFPFRCDSPSSYRAMRLWVAPLSEGWIEFRSVLVTISTQPHKLDILSSSSATSSHSFLMCAWCKAIKAGTEWRPLETVLEDRSVLTQASLPTILHDVCDSCLESYLRDDAAGG